MEDLGKRRIIFVGGVHGVGKTTFCKLLESKLSINHFSASELIRRAKQEELPLNKRVEDLDQNQELFLSALQQYTKPKDWNIIDGHFCLLDTKGNVAKIPFRTFVEMNPSAIMIIFDDAEKIYRRLIQRDGTKYDIDSVSDFQKQEIDYSKYVAQNLKIPFMLCNYSKGIDNGHFFVEKLVSRD